MKNLLKDLKWVIAIHWVVVVLGITNFLLPNNEICNRYRYFLDQFLDELENDFDQKNNYYEKKKP